jgi:hypothetical protein
MAGTKEFPLRFPVAYQEAVFGVNTGGTNSAFVAVNADTAFDSWLTVGITDSDAAGKLGSIGINWSSWTESTNLFSNDGAVFWMNPDGPSGDAVLAQLTIPSTTFDAGTTAQALLQGRSTTGEDWQEQVTWRIGHRPT